MMNLVLWGGGERANNFIQFFGSKCVVAVIDSDKEKVGKLFSGIPIIDFNTYKKKYLNLPIVVTPLMSESIIQLLQRNDIYHYLIMEDCPFEVWFSYGKKNMLEERIRGFSKNKKYLIYGQTVFSWYLCMRLQQIGAEVYIMTDNAKSLSLVNIIEEQLHTQFITDISEMEYKNIDFVIWSSAERNSKLVDWFSDEQMIEMYDLLPVHTGYCCHELLKFQNIHQGKRCFIVGNGPSLRYDDLESLHKHHEITFSVNRGYMAFPYTKWRPDYYVVGDVLALAQFRKELLSDIDCDRFFLSNYDEFWEGVSDERICKLYMAHAKDADEYIKFSDDIVKGCYAGRTIVYVCTQIAVYMGFTQIYLIGADCSYTGAPQSDGNHFYKEQHADTIRSAGFEYEKVINDYQSAKRYADKHGIKIYNATRGGQLDIFERVDFDSIF